MQQRFSKFHGTGNDFILMDNRDSSVNLSSNQIRLLCDRHLGIGADGLMLMNASSEFDFSMIYFNSDGNEGSMCGNGGRCIAAYANSVGIRKKSLIFSAVDGNHEAHIIGRKGDTYDVSVSLNEVRDIEKMNDRKYILNTGSPHYVEFVDDPDSLDILSAGRKIRWDPHFQPDGVNVNFVRKEKQTLYVKTYERGVENMTLSCGTGVTASAIAASEDEESDRMFWTVQTLGGLLKVNFKKGNNVFSNIWLSGSAVKVFDGVMEIV